MYRIDTSTHIKFIICINKNKIIKINFWCFVINNNYWITY